MTKAKNKEKEGEPKEEVTPPVMTNESTNSEPTPEEPKVETPKEEVKKGEPAPVLPHDYKPEVTPPVMTNESVAELMKLYPFAGNGWKLQRAVKEARDKGNLTPENVKAIYVRIAGRLVDPETGR